MGCSRIRSKIGELKDGSGVEAVAGVRTQDVIVLIRIGGVDPDFVGEGTSEGWAGQIPGIPHAGCRPVQRQRLT